MPSCQKIDMMIFVKNEFKKIVRRAPPPVEYLVVLPNHFDQFRSTGQVRQSYLPGQVPATCPTDFLATVTTLEGPFRCRGTGSVASASLQLAIAGGGTQVPMQLKTAGGQLERFAGSIMQGMTQIRDNQAILMQAVSSSPSLLHAFSSSPQQIFIVANCAN